MRKARKHGDLFPAIGQNPQPAPLGSNQPNTQGSWLKRLRNEASWSRHSNHHIELPNWPSLHIMHLTDVHLRDSGPFLDRIVVELTGLNPDIIAITGDLVTKGYTTKAIQRFCKALPDVPKFAILGNWEHWVIQDLSEWRQILKEYNIQLLVEQSETLVIKGVELTILGTDDHLAGNSNPKSLCDSLNSGPTLCLTHSPAHFPQLCREPVDLILAGHAHGGQIRLPRIGAFWTPKGTGQYVSGWYSKENHHMFVSRGMGWSVAPIRLHCPPEIAHIWVNQ